MSYTQAEYKPSKDNVLVKVPIVKDKTEGGIIKSKSDMDKEIKERGLNLFFEVIAIGPGVKEHKVGMKVLSIRPAMDLPDVVSDDADFKLAFLPEYSIEGYV